MLFISCNHMHVHIYTDIYKRIHMPLSMQHVLSLECYELASTVSATKEDFGQQGLCIVQWRLRGDRGGATPLTSRLIGCHTKINWHQGAPKVLTSNLAMREAESLKKKALRLCVFRNWQLHQAEESVQYFVVSFNEQSCNFLCSGESIIPMTTLLLRSLDILSYFY